MINEEWQKRIDEFNAWDNDMIIPGKLTNDGAHNVWIEETRNPRGKRRKKYAEPKVKVDDSVFESAKQAVAPKEVKKDEIEESRHPQSEGNIAENPPETVEIQAVEEECISSQNPQDKPNKTLKMPLRKLFDELYDTWLEVKWKDRRNMLINALKPYFENEYKKTVAFVDSNLDRRRHNNGSRFRRARDKCNLNRFNYFVTFTYSDAKMDRETFKKKLSAYLKNKVNRSGWKYYGVWEGWDGKKRLHFHALMYIPDGTMPGELVEEKSYNTSKHKMKLTMGNTEFNEKFGRSDVEEIIEPVKDYAYQYVLKYLNKGGKAMASKNCPGEIIGWVTKRDLLCESSSVENRYIAFPDTQIIVDGTGEVVTVNERKPQEALRQLESCG